MSNEYEEDFNEETNVEEPRLNYIKWLVEKDIDDLSSIRLFFRL